MKLAIVHDSLTVMGGAERVLQAIHEIYPEAPIFTLVYDRKLAEHFENWQIISSPLQYLYNIVPRFQFLLPLIPWALRFWNFSEFDLVLSSSSIFAKCISVPKNIPHINYCHTPARFLWLDKEKYLQEEVPWLLRPLLKMFLYYLQRWDYNGAQRVSHFIANSKNVQERIEKFYNRHSTIIHPFVDSDFFYPDTAKEDYYLLAGRLHAHKRPDLVISLFNKLGKKLHVVGSGRVLNKLKIKALDNIQFFGRIEDPLLRRQYSGARAFIYPQEEDFGIMPLEALACGTPVIAYGKGGILETMNDKTAVFFDTQSEESLKMAVERFDQTNFYSQDLFEQAEKFSKQTFKDQISLFVNNHAHSN